MKKIISIIFLFILLLTNPSAVNADEFYDIESFRSKITVEKDTSLSVTETINVNFKVPRHGIYRVIPVVYSAKGKTINSRLKIESIEDDRGNNYIFEKERLKQSISLKIGDPDKEIVGPHTYIIKYKVFDVLQNYNGSYELYWNVSGHEWDTEILNSEAVISSPYADIEKADCFSGEFGSISKDCEYSLITGNTANFRTLAPINPGDDFTVVADFTVENSFLPPSVIQKLIQTILNNWGYLISPVPLYLILYFWYRRGRDEKYKGANIYYREDEVGVEITPLFAREHLPLVYHPIDGLSPGEVGVIVDEKVDIEDVLSEILELARLGFIEIRKIAKKKFLKDQLEYAFIKTAKFDNEKERAKLEEYQDYLLRQIFKEKALEKSEEISEDLLKGNSRETLEAKRQLSGKEYVLLGGLKNNFYESLPKFKEKLYKRMESENLFFEDPEKVRAKWTGIYIVIEIIAFWVVITYSSATANFGPLLTLILLSLPGFFVAYKMPRRTPAGYSYKRQIEGLSWYLEKGKWRHEIAEKNLFIEEILPLAVALGVVDRLTRDMADLGVKPPEYISGVSANTFSNDFSTFRNASTNSFFSTPQGKWSGSSSWSGGSGFSGGSSGGGFGGGGGGSW